MAAAGKKKPIQKSGRQQAKPALKTPAQRIIARKVVRIDTIHFRSHKVSSKKLFLGSLIVMGIFIMAGSSRMGVAADEPIDYGYGKACLHYFSSFGKDTSYAALTIDNVKFPDQKYYGAAFEMIAPAINAFIDPSNPFVVHHFLSALAGIVLLLFTGLIAGRLRGWTAALLALWMIFLTPVVTGNAFFNSKDIPFAAAFAAGMYYLIGILGNFPNISRAAWTGLMLSTFSAIAVRVSGILLPAYIGFFTLLWWYAKDRREKIKVSPTFPLSLAIAMTVGSLAAFLTYPNFWHEGLHHITGALAATKKFQHNIYMLYDDKILASQKIDTASYLGNYVMMTIPEIVLAAFGIAVALLAFRRKFKYRFDWMLLFAAIFPFAYVVLIKAPIYNGWRHVLFAYPFVVAVATIGLIELIQLSKSSWRRSAVTGIIVIAFADLFVWQLRAFPYNYIYYNHLSGGLPEIYKHYDTDYQQLATHDGVKWLISNEKPTGKITILSNNANALQEEYDSMRVKFKFVAIKDMWVADWDYAVISTMFLNEKAINVMFPPLGTLHTIDRFDVPLSFVVKRHTREGVAIYNMIHHDSLKYAGALIDSAYRTNKTNTMAWYWKGCDLFLNKDYQNSLQFGIRYNELFPGLDYNCELMAYNYYRLHRFQEALDYLILLSKKNPSKKSYYQLIADCLTNTGRPEQAKIYYQKASEK